MDIHRVAWWMKEFIEYCEARRFPLWSIEEDSEALNHEHQELVYSFLKKTDALANLQKVLDSNTDSDYTAPANQT